MLAPYRQKIIEFTKPLPIWQKLYFLALAIGLYKLVFSDDEISDFTLVGAIAVMALSVEVWPKFVEIWETLLGRVIVVVTYAIVGNFVVVFARHQLNEVVGVDPGTLFYATSFVSIITAPVWIVTITLIVMFLYMVIKQLWFIATFVPWLIGLYEKNNNQVAMYPKLTRITRIVMVPFMFMFLISILKLYDDEETVKGGSVKGITSSIVEGLEASGAVVIQEDVPTEVIAEPESNTEPEPAKDSEVELDKNNVTFLSGQAMNETIAEFVYYFEAFAHSQCIKEESERIVAIGEYDILAVKPDENSDYGYHFSVRECKLKNYSQN